MGGAGRLGYLTVLGAILIAAACPPAVRAQDKLYRAQASSSDPRDFSGVWNLRLRNRAIRTTNNQLPPFTPLGQAEWNRRHDAELRGTPMPDASTQCFPHGIPRLMNSPYPIQFIASPGKMTILHEVGHNVRHIYLDEKLPAQVKPSFLGDSVGHWEGDTLVIETKGFDLRTWLDEEGVIHSDQMSVVERLRKVENGMAIEDEFTITDPVFFTRPWAHRLVYAWAPDMRLTEYICEENNRDAPVNGVVVAK